MNTYQDADATPTKPPLAKRAIALLIIVAAVALLAKIVIGFVLAIFWIIVAVAAALAVLWALKTLL
jgi:hypothetical protein